MFLCRWFLKTKSLLQFEPKNNFPPEKEELICPRAQSMIFFTKKPIRFGVSGLTCGKSGVVALLVTLTVVPDVAEDGAEDEMLKAETDEVGGGC